MKYCSKSELGGEALNLATVIWKRCWVGGEGVVELSVMSKVPEPLTDRLGSGEQLLGNRTGQHACGGLVMEMERQVTPSDDRHYLAGAGDALRRSSFVMW